MTTPNRPPLSPAAQAVLEAWVAAKRTQTRTAGRYAPLAAALRAILVGGIRTSGGGVILDGSFVLAIAAELEAQS